MEKSNLKFVKTGTFSTIYSKTKACPTPYNDQWSLTIFLSRLILPLPSDQLLQFHCPKIQYFTVPRFSISLFHEDSVFLFSTKIQYSSFPRLPSLLAHSSSHLMQPLGGGVAQLKHNCEQTVLLYWSLLELLLMHFDLLICVFEWFNALTVGNWQIWSSVHWSQVGVEKNRVWYMWLTPNYFQFVLSSVEGLDKLLKSWNSPCSCSMASLCSHRCTVDQIPSECHQCLKIVWSKTSSRASKLHKFEALPGDPLTTATCVAKQARKLQATLVRNYDLLTGLLTDGGEV